MNPKTLPAPRRLNITLGDDTELTGDHYLCGQGTGRGTVLIRTPYDRQQYQAQASAWLARGHDVLVQNVRGRYGSTGVWLPYSSEGQDGAQTARVMEREGLLNGPLILAGASYDAHCALETARCLETDGHQVPLTAVIAMVPALGLFETARNPDGTARLRDRIGWWHMHGFTAESRDPLTPADLDRRCHEATEQGLAHTIPANIYGAHAPDQWNRLWSAPKLDFGARYGSCQTPLLVISGHQDFFAYEAIDLAAAWDAGNTGFLTGPWGHRLAVDLNSATAAMLRRHGGLMAQIQNFLDRPDTRPFTREFTPCPEGTDPWTPSDLMRVSAQSKPTVLAECESSS